jgi:hypothetical protein
MDTGPRISYVEKRDDLLVITFADGSSALYTSDLLHSMIPKAIQVLDQQEEKRGVSFEDLSNYDDRRL